MDVALVKVCFRAIMSFAICKALDRDIHLRSQKTGHLVNVALYEKFSPKILALPS